MENTNEATPLVPVEPTANSKLVLMNQNQTEIVNSKEEENEKK